MHERPSYSETIDHEDKETQNITLAEALRAVVFDTGSLDFTIGKLLNRQENTRKERERLHQERKNLEVVEVLRAERSVECGDYQEEKRDQERRCHLAC